ncbi:MAG: hypothetical protein JST82_06070 [Bacteroidetes bacterium]|nr:hypothetical protein [Bacteroidota bacterium]
MKHKLLNAALIITSLFGYMEWGKGNSAFIFSAEMEVIRRLFTDTKSAVHPLTVIPLLGQILLLLTLFQKEPSKIITYIAIGCLGILLLFLFLIGIGDGNSKMAIAASPFLIVSILAIASYRKVKKAKNAGAIK